MSVHDLEFESPVAWPSNGISEVPFRLYTDPEQYRLEQERIFKGPTWNYLCLAAEIPDARRLGRHDGRRGRGHRRPRTRTARSTPSSTAAPIAATCCA